MTRWSPKPRSPKSQRPIHEVIVLLFAWVIAGIFLMFMAVSIVRPGSLHEDVRNRLLEDMKLIIMLVAGYVAGHANTVSSGRAEKNSRKRSSGRIRKVKKPNP